MQLMTLQKILIIPIFLMNLSLVIYVFFKTNKNDFLRNYFLVFNIFLLIWILFAVFGVYINSINHNMGCYFTSCPLTNAGFLFFKSFTSQKKISKKFLVISYAISLLIASGFLINKFFIDTTAHYDSIQVHFYPLVLIYVLYVFVIICAFLYLGVNSLKSRAGLIQYQTRYIILGFSTMALLLFTNNIVLTILGHMEYSTIGNMGIILFVMAISYALIRYHFLGATVFIKTSSVLGSIACVLTTYYLLLLFFAQKFLDKLFLNYPNFVKTGVTILMFLTVFVFFDKIKRFLGYFFLSREKELDMELSNISSQSLKMLDFEEVMLFLVNELKLILRTKNILIVVWDEVEGMFRVKTSNKNFEMLSYNKNSLMNLFNKEKSLAIRDVLEARGEFQIFRNMKNSDTEICIPFYNEGKCKGFIGIGSRIKGGYSNEEIFILEKYTKILGVAIENSLKVLYGNEFVDTRVTTTLNILPGDDN